MLRHVLDQRLMEGAPLERGHGKPGRVIPGVLTGFELGERARAQTGGAMKGAFGV